MPARGLPAWRTALIGRILLQGGVIAYPTEGVWGLGCDPENAWAVAQILDLKQRSWNQGLILIASNVEQFQPYLEGLPRKMLTPLEKPSMETGPHASTYLVPDNGIAPHWIVGAHDTLAVRVSNHPVVAELCSLLDGPIVSTSANPSGRSAARTALRVRQYFGEGIDYLVPGELGAGRGASEIRMLATGEIIREAG